MQNKEQSKTTIAFLAALKRKKLPTMSKYLRLDIVEKAELIKIPRDIYCVTKKSLKLYKSCLNQKYSHVIPVLEADILRILPKNDEEIRIFASLEKAESFVKKHQDTMMDSSGEHVTKSPFILKAQLNFWQVISHLNYHYLAAEEGVLLAARNLKMVKVICPESVTLYNSITLPHLDLPKLLENNQEQQQLSSCVFL